MRKDRSQETFQRTGAIHDYIRTYPNLACHWPQKMWLALLNPHSLFLFVFLWKKAIRRWSGSPHMFWGMQSTLCAPSPALVGKKAQSKSSYGKHALSCDKYRKRQKTEVWGPGRHQGWSPRLFAMSETLRAISSFLLICLCVSDLPGQMPVRWYVQTLTPVLQAVQCALE